MPALDIAASSRGRHATAGEDIAALRLLLLSEETAETSYSQNATDRGPVKKGEEAGGPCTIKVGNDGYNDLQGR